MINETSGASSTAKGSGWWRIRTRQGAMSHVLQISSLSTPRVVVLVSEQPCQNLPVLTMFEVKWKMEELLCLESFWWQGALQFQVGSRWLCMFFLIQISLKSIFIASEWLNAPGVEKKTQRSAVLAVEPWITAYASLHTHPHTTLIHSWIHFSYCSSLQAAKMTTGHSTNRIAF